MSGTREVASSSARPPASEFNPSVTGWFNTVPLTSNNSTLSRRSAKHRLANPDVYVKDYIKKRNLILALLVGGGDSCGETGRGAGDGAEETRGGQLSRVWE